MSIGAPESDKKMESGPLPRHVAIIMDGNGRWAKAKGMPRAEGHRQGVKTIRRIVEESRRLGIRYLTLYAFSSENWSRPEEEVSMLMKLFEYHLEHELKLLLENDIRLRMIGEVEKLPVGVAEKLQKSQENSFSLDGMDLILAISYGGRDEILKATRAISRAVRNEDITPEEIDSELFRKFLYAPDIPDPDLMIRTSGESRISNFLLWQIAYSEIVISPKMWPEFSVEDFQSCLEDYSGRSRRFGKTGEQIKQSYGS